MSKPTEYDVSGKITYSKHDGDLVMPGDVLANIELDSDCEIERPDDFTSTYEIKVQGNEVIEKVNKDLLEFSNNFRTNKEWITNTNIQYNDVYSKNNTTNPYLFPNMMKATCCKELVMENNTLKEVTRPINSNTIGMIGWRLTLDICNSDMDIILIANDLGHRHGTFGRNEDLFFKKMF